MANLIANGEQLRLVRAKMNATLNPYASRAEFEAANIPTSVLMVYAIDGSDVYALIRDQSGDWSSGDGAKWTARIDGGLSSELLAQAVADSAASRDAAETAQGGAEDAAEAAVTAQGLAQTAAANAQASALTCATWAVLSGLTGSTAGQGAEVLDSDTGTHTDPVVGGTVNNAGRYSWSVIPAGWQRIANTGLSSKADEADLAVTDARTAPLRIATGANGHLQIVDANGAELLGFDSDGKAILRLSARALDNLRDTLGTYLLSIDASPYPSMRDTDGVELLGFNDDGEALFAVSQNVADQVSNLLNIGAIYDPVAAGVLPSRDVFVIGDSMTSSTVTSAISTALSGRSVSYLQQGGSTAATLAVMMGARPLTVTVSGNTIPASGGVSITAKSENILGLGNDTLTFNCSIGGIAGVMSTDTSGNWTFTRSADGSATTVAAGVACVLSATSGTSYIPATDTYRGDTCVIRLGRNGLRTTRPYRTTYTLEPIRQIVDFLTPRVKNVVIVGPYNGRAKDHSTGADNEPSGSAYYTDVMTLIEEMRREFGRLFLDMRTAAVKNAIYDLALTPTTDDLADMALDCIPRQLFATSDNTHVSTTMQAWEGQFIGNHLRALGF